MRDFLPVIWSDSGTNYKLPDSEESLYNCVPWVLPKGEIGACPRNEFTFDSNNAFSSANRGRGVVTFAGNPDLYLDETDYVYSGGSQDLTATTAPGYAGNTGFNEEYTASFVRHPIGGAPSALVIVNAGHTSTHASANHGNIWWTGSASVAPASISDADLPCNNGVSITRGGASLDGFFFVCDINGKIYNSDIDDITNWTATNFIKAEREPDIGIYIGKHHDNVVYIGTRSIEFLYNAGNASASPLARRQDVSYSVGCYFPNTIVEVGDVIYFVGTDHQGISSVYKIENFQLSIISTPKLDEKFQLAGIGTYPDISELDSLFHQFWMSYSASHDSGGLILTYDYQWTYYWHQNTGQWARWDYNATNTFHGGVTVATWNGIFPIMSYNGTNSSTGGVSKYQFINGEIAQQGTIDNDAINDLGNNNSPNVFMQFPMWDAGTEQRKKVKWVRVITEPKATTATTADPATVLLSWYDYDATNAGGPNPPGDYTGDRSMNLNIAGARTSRLGSTRRRQFMLEWPTGHGPISVVKGLEIEYEIV